MWYLYWGNSPIMVDGCTDCAYCLDIIYTVLYTLSKYLMNAYFKTGNKKKKESLTEELNTVNVKFQEVWIKMLPSHSTFCTVSTTFALTLYYLFHFSWLYFIVKSLIYSRYHKICHKIETESWIRQKMTHSIPTGTTLCTGRSDICFIQLSCRLSCRWIWVHHSSFLKCKRKWCYIGNCS